MDIPIMIAFTVNLVIYIVILFESFTSNALIDKLWWGVIFIVWSIYSLIWLYHQMDYGSSTIATGNYTIAFATQTVFSTIVLAPLGFIGRITDDRFKDYLTLYLLTSTITILLGMDVIFKLKTLITK